MSDDSTVQPARKKMLSEIDRLLRGGFTRREDLRAGRIDVPVRTLVQAGLFLGGLYGVMMGLFALSDRGGAGLLQLIATTVKVPMLFLLTLVVTYPSLYVFSALARTRLHAPQTLKLLLAAIGVNLAVLASFGPVTAFFTVSTTSYPFMILLNVLFFGVSGIAGLTVLSHALRSIFESDEPQPAPAPAPPPASPTALTPIPPTTTAGSAPEGGAGEAAAPAAPAKPTVAPPIRVPPPGPVMSPGQRVFTIWIVIYAVVGAQMGWVMRPFIGSPDLPFQLFRGRESNFFESVIRALGQLFS